MKVWLTFVLAPGGPLFKMDRKNSPYHFLSGKATTLGGRALPRVLGSMVDRTLAGFTSLSDDGYIRVDIPSSLLSSSRAVSELPILESLARDFPRFPSSFTPALDVLGVSLLIGVGSTSLPFLSRSELGKLDTHQAIHQLATSKYSTLLKQATDNMNLADVALLQGILEKPGSAGSWLFFCLVEPSLAARAQDVCVSSPNPSFTAIALVSRHPLTNTENFLYIHPEYVSQALEGGFSPNIFVFDSLLRLAPPPSSQTPLRDKAKPVAFILYSLACVSGILSEKALTSTFVKDLKLDSGSASDGEGRSNRALGAAEDWFLLLLTPGVNLSALNVLELLRYSVPTTSSMALCRLPGPNFLGAAKPNGPAPASALPNNGAFLTSLASLTRSDGATSGYLVHFVSTASDGDIFSVLEGIRASPDLRALWPLGSNWYMIDGFAPDKLLPALSGNQSCLDIAIVGGYYYNIKFHVKN